ncbi:MAG: hypothetical protein GWN84_18230 [Gammaproteobacteria bacterium]|nr:hypothetical protein [Gammaproteobacteria bacterium]NIV76456.1 hypothetical protein [Gammaproteobacteria bacterium]
MPRQRLVKEVHDLVNLLREAEIDPRDPELQFARRLFLHCLQWRLAALSKTRIQRPPARICH